VDIIGWALRSRYIQYIIARAKHVVRGCGSERRASAKKEKRDEQAGLFGLQATVAAAFAG
jgi:hypothetical protein